MRSLTYCTPKVKRVAATNVFDLLDKVFDQSFGTTYPNYRTHTGTNRVNILENKKDFQIEALLPGFTKSDIQITLDKNILTITAEQKQDTTTEQESEEEGSASTYRRREFKYTTFKRSFELPETVEATNINAKHENGILTVSLPKQEKVMEPVVQTIQVV